MKMLGLLLLVLVTGCQSNSTAEDARVEAVEVGSIPNTHAFGDILLAGQPSREDFELLAEEGTATVITLRTAPEVTDYDEGQLVESLGMRFVSVPFRAPETLTDEVFEAIRTELENAEGPTVLHCGSANRVGAVWIPWRVLDGGVPLEQAVLEAKEIGLRYEPFELRAIDYVERKLAER